MKPGTCIPLALMALTLATAACGSAAGELAAPKPTTDATTQSIDTSTTAIDPKTTQDAKPGTSEAEGKKAFNCPMTIPPEPGFAASEPSKVTYSKNFPTPDAWPREYPHKSLVWYGSTELWTALSVDGDHSPRKSVWWSANFPGGIVEGEPEVWVTWTRLDTDQFVVIDNGGKATNAYTPEEGWFMIAGIDPDQPGCWEVEATYKGASLSYVYEKTG